MYKFKQNDIFYNTVKTYPKYSFVMYNNNLYINNQINEGNNKSSGSIKLSETNNVVSADADWISYQKSYSGGNVSLIPITFSQGQLTASIKRSFIKQNYYPYYDEKYTTKNAPFKLLSLANTLNYYLPLSDEYNSDNFLDKFIAHTNSPIPTYLPTPGNSPNNLISPKKNTCIIEIPSTLYGSSINPGTLDLQFYFTGSLIGRAQDINLNGEIIQTTGAIGLGSVVGVVLYNEGIILLNSYDFILPDTPTVKDWYIQPTASGYTPALDYPRWSNFGSYQNISGIASKEITSSAYIMSFEGTNTIPTLTMLVHANKNDLNWSNNPSYLQSGSFNTYLAVTSSTKYIENSQLNIKNTISSSFANYSASFEPQTFINSIGIYNEEGELIAVAKTANPVRKTNEQDYTFKLKIDL